MFKACARGLIIFINLNKRYTIQHKIYIYKTATRRRDWNDNNYYWHSSILLRDNRFVLMAKISEHYTWCIKRPNPIFFNQSTMAKIRKYFLAIQFYTHIVLMGLHSSTNLSQNIPQNMLIHNILFLNWYGR